MALFSCSQLPIISTTIPAKKTTLNHLILRTHSLVLCPRHETQSLPSLLALRATPPRKYVYPDPIPEFAQAETQKFKIELRKKLLKDEDAFGDELDKVVEVCAKILYEFLSKDYGGPGTLLVEPFTDMLLSLKDNNLPGAPLAARASLLWAQNCIDIDWQAWSSTSNDQVN